MKKILMFVALPCLLIISGFAIHSCSTPPSNQEASDIKDESNDIRALFNGKDLTGWEAKNGTAPFTVEEGMIVGTYVSGTPNTFLCTTEKFSDFILTFEAKMGEGNSGVMFRAQSNEEYQNGRVHGYQMEMDPGNRAWTGGIYDEARRAWIYNMEYNPQAKTALKKNEWNSYRIEAIGNSLRTWINGIPAANLVDDLDASGFIGLQVHSTDNNEKLIGETVKFKNINIITTKLDKHRTKEETEVTEVSYLQNKLTDHELSDGWKLLWDGQSTNGWRGAKLDKFPEAGWSIKDGVLAVEENGGHESTNGGDIVTVEEYENFILEVDFKLTKGANSGVKYFVDTELNMGKGSSIGCEYQLLDDKYHPDALAGKDGNRTLASLYDMIPANAKNFNADLPYVKLRREYSWNRAKIIVQGDDVEHYLNGLLMVKYNRSGQQWRDQVADSKYKVWPNFGEGRRGHILLQDHGNLVYFKNIKIKEL